MLCEVPGCDSRVRIVPGMGVVCEAGHAYHSMRYAASETVAASVHPVPAAPARTSPFVMLFGKHKGEPVHDLPSGYIMWLLEKVENMDARLREELEAQMEMREGRGVVRKAARIVGRASTRPSQASPTSRSSPSPSDTPPSAPSSRSPGRSTG